VLSLSLSLSLSLISHSLVFSHSSDQRKTCNSRVLCLFIYLLIYLNRIWAAAPCRELRAARFRPRASESTGATADMCSSRRNLKFIFRMNPEWSRCIEHFRRAEVCYSRREISVAIRNVTYTYLCADILYMRACVRTHVRVYPMPFTLQDLRAASNLEDYSSALLCNPVQMYRPH